MRRAGGGGGDDDDDDDGNDAGGTIVASMSQHPPRSVTVSNKHTPHGGTRHTDSADRGPQSSKTRNISLPKVIKINIYQVSYCKVVALRYSIPI